METQAGSDALPARSEPRAEATTLAIPNAGRLLAVAYAGCAAVLALAGLLGAIIEQPIAYFTREPESALQVATCTGVECTFVGFVSHLGVLFWAGTAAICLFSAALLAGREGERLLTSPYFAFGALTAVVAADDVFLLHDYSYEWGIALNERRIAAAYALSTVVLVLVFRRFLARTTFWLYPLALVLFATSVTVDALVGGLHLVEDGSKLLGIATWSLFLVGTALVDLRGRSADAVPDG